MKCPHCKIDGDTEVKDSRPYETWIRRRRLCLACGKSYSTYERIEELEKIKPEDVLRLRALAMDILNRTEAMPVLEEPLPQSQP